MQLYYSGSVIKADNAKLRGEVLIKSKDEVDFQDTPKVNVFFEEEYKNYQSLANSILIKSKKDREEIIEKAYKDASLIEEQAYKKGFEKGFEKGSKDGYEHGYKESYEKYIEIAKAEGEEIKNNATELLLSAKTIYENYLAQKEEEIVVLAVRIAENAIRQRLESHDGLNALVQEAIEASKSAKSYIVKCHGKHLKELESAIHGLKATLAAKGEILLVEDKSLAPGNAIIEKDNGRVELGVDVVLAKLKEEFNR